MLEHLFGSKTRVKLLQILFRHPERILYVRELARLVNVQMNAVRRELANLETIGIIVQVEAKNASEGTGTERSKYYKLNQACLMYHELKALLVKSQILEEQELVHRIKEKSGQIDLLLLTGVFTNIDDSGTDMLLVGNIKTGTLEKIIKEYEANSSTSIRYTVMDKKEFVERREIGDKFLYHVLESKHVMVVDNYQIG
ncbi:MAG: hypothetical protein A2261_00585 [Candidatus Magasanikbacteria bacterium RIFOXYA2_FULL_44_8]|uniref:HTH arsR-type domain-containing protein n=1 Tax=Candidatus Magasanikbacteria bacterium RIFOXYA2_FULL_44_8 TaxID=1798696 RepID=A0A1F6NK33_9BACT|nr:MAG: hypothetical protein A2261_00585 [Candidatus Magasanikbacteria bacterium RIFOXYA2_FULL_44_8]